MHRFIDRLHGKTCDTVIDHLGDRAPPPSNDWRALAHSFDHDQAEWLWPIDRKQKSQGVAEKLSLLLIVYFPNEFDQWVIQLRSNDMFEILFVGGIDLRGNLRRQAVLNSSQPIRKRQRPSLARGNRNQRHGRKGAVNRMEIGEVEPSVERRQTFLPG